MNELQKSVLMATLMIFGMGLGLMLLVQTLNYFNATDSCEKLSGYGYLTSLEGSFWTRYDCLILMQDGTKVYDYDFSIADYKKPIQQDKQK